MFCKLLGFLTLTALISKLSAEFYGFPNEFAEDFPSHLEQNLNYDSLVQDNNNQIIEVESWPEDPALRNLGQVSGVAVCPENNVHIFHRGDVIWNENSFDVNNIYQFKSRGAISNDTIYDVDPEKGKLISSWGKNKFYMPHGISFDAAGNIWLTDVALHQVFRFKKGKVDEPDLVLGEAFVPGSDDKHFCKPTDIAVSSSGIVYISDGYCNSRILMVSPDGHPIGQIGINEEMLIPHSLTLLEQEDLICVADRENRRILCYTAGLAPNSQPGKLVFNIQHPQLGRVFAIDHYGDIILALNGPDQENPRPRGITLDLATEQMLGSWAPKAGGFVDPHALAISPDGSSLYVTDLIGDENSKKVYKFKM